MSHKGLFPGMKVTSLYGTGVVRVVRDSDNFLGLFNFIVFIIFIIIIKLIIYLVVDLSYGTGYLQGSSIIRNISINENAELPSPPPIPPVLSSYNSLPFEKGLSFNTHSYSNYFSYVLFICKGSVSSLPFDGKEVSSMCVIQMDLIQKYIIYYTAIFIYIYGSNIYIYIKLILYIGSEKWLMLILNFSI